MHSKAKLLKQIIALNGTGKTHSFLTVMVIVSFISKLYEAWDMMSSF